MYWALCWYHCSMAVRNIHYNEKAIIDIKLTDYEINGKSSNCNGWWKDIGKSRITEAGTAGEQKVVVNYLTAVQLG